MKKSSLSITNARENNLKGLNIEIPHDCYTVVTGVSGSGKSSLAFDTVYAEGQRRYIETFSPYTRQFFDRVKKPSVDLIKNVRPAIAIQQRTRITNSRSTVGTVTNLLDYIKILWSNLATARCPECGIGFENWSVDSLSRHIQSLLALKSAATYLVCSRVKIKKLSAKAELTRLATLGFSRIYNGSLNTVERIDEINFDDYRSAEEILLVLDRIKSGKISFTRVKEAVEQAFAVAGGSCVLIESDSDSEKKKRPFLTISNDGLSKNSRQPAHRLLEFHSTIGCPISGLTVERPRPSLFTFNHPSGACPECKGFGMVLAIDKARCVPNPKLSIKSGAIQCWSSDSRRGEYKKLIRFCESQKISTTMPWEKLPGDAKEKIFNHSSREYRGIFPWFKKLERKIYKMHVRVLLSRYRMQVTCSACNGTRLKSAALAYRIGGLSIADIMLLPISELQGWLIDIENNLTDSKRISRELRFVFSAVQARLQYLDELGLGYLTLDRQARTLSGGETQRVNLATALGSELTSTQFVLDEPSVGLHSRDTARLVRALKDLSARPNSLLVVEHDLDCIGAAEHVIELGPEAGIRGGEIVFSGANEDWAGIKFEPELSRQSPASTSPKLIVSRAFGRNLKGFNLVVPLESFVCLTGVSGSGKSTFIEEVIKKGWETRGADKSNAGHSCMITGFDSVDQLLVVDQSPLAKSPRSNVATYTDIWEEVRKLLAQSDAAKLRGLNKSSFSFNVDGGRCPNCKGAGFITEDMQFLSDVYLPCELCLGSRFQSEVLEVTYNGKNAHDFLVMTVDEALSFFKEQSPIIGSCEILSQLGLGHLTLGHPLSELSGGEAQRLKLVPFLNEAASGKALLIFDEPTTGLHLRDVQKLLNLFRNLRDRGHSVLCVEHNLYLIAASDWIIDLGPEGGQEGGFLIAEGTPRDLVDKRATFAKHSYTAEALYNFLREKGKSNGNASTRAAARSKKLSMGPRDLIVQGAREHNLKNLDIKIPPNSTVALTGVSGSGKSSIAKDIIYAEGQRRFLDCLSPYARQFIKELTRPDIDRIANVQPTVCVYQHTFQPSRLSTVATMSEVYNYLRLLYAKAGVQYCPDHPKNKISSATAAEIADEIKTLSLPSVRILAPIIKLKKGHHRTVLERAQQSEISEVRADGLFGPPSRFFDALDRRRTHSIEFVIGKFNPSAVDLSSITDAVNQALALGAGTLIVHHAHGENVFSSERTCAVCKRGFFKPDPEDLSFNSRRGVCSACKGTARGKNGEACPTCLGSRLNPLGSNIRLAGKSIHEACLLTAPALAAFLKSLKYESRQKELVEAVFSELFSKLEILSGIGLDYLPLDRDCATLSSGEVQRLRLATAIGSPLTSTMYIFDEPSAGLHPNDTKPVLDQLTKLHHNGNSLIIIEHDPASILACENIIDVGPGGGADGGEIVFSGSLRQFLDESHSSTAIHVRRALSGHYKESLSAATNGGIERHKAALTIVNGKFNNVSCKNLSIPLHKLVTVAGVSGAGKSSLVNGILADTINLGKAGKLSWTHAENILQSDTHIERVIYVDQKPIGINSRSTPASYLGIWDEIRKVFANTIEAKSRGWPAGHFSYNTGKGRCSVCKGLGQLKLEMNFLPDAFIVCDQCSGSRYEQDTLSVHYQSRTISDVLKLSFAQAKPIFANHRRIHQALTQACDVGLGYLCLGQSSVTLSGGESQRIKLVSELSASRKGHTLYLLDEPTIGLHKADVAKLIGVLQELISLGHSVIVIEHDEEFIYGSDHLIELGPGPGENGGRVIFSGNPRTLAGAVTPWGSIARNGGSLNAA